MNSRVLHDLWSAIIHVTGRQRQDLPISASVTDLATHFPSLFTDHSHTGQIPCGPVNELSLTEFKPVTAGMVKRLLKDLVPTKAPDPDEITPSELKMVADKIASTVSILTNLFHRVCFQLSSKWPSVFPC